MNRTMIAGPAALLVLAACGEKKTANPGMGNMPGMQGMAMRSDSLMPMMRAHLDSMAGMPPQSASSMLAVHDAMMSQMLDAMGSDMMMMNMRPDSAWTALTDSIKRDLADLPSLSERALEPRVKAHVGRMRKLLDMHVTMVQ